MAKLKGGTGIAGYTACHLGNLYDSIGDVQPQYTTTTAAAEAWYRVATIPMTSQFKNTIFKVKAYTATGTMTESTITINLAYYSGSYSQETSAITANTSHSYNYQSNVENGYVLLYCRVSFDGTSGYIDLYSYKTTAITMIIQPLVNSDWVWTTGALTANPTVGSYRSTSCTLYAGSTSNTGYISSANYASSTAYSNYGVLGAISLSDTNDKTGKWSLIGYWRFTYNASYLEGRSGNIRMRVQEVNFDGSIAPASLDDFGVNFKAGLATHTDSATFNTNVPTVSVEIDGKTSLTVNDIAAVITETTTAQKTIGLYIKLKGANTVYCLNPEQRYGRSFNSSNVNTTTYCTFYYADSRAVLAALPTAAQGSAVYATFRHVIGVTNGNVDGTWYPGTTDPTGSTRNNFSGEIWATRCINVGYADYAELFKKPLGTDFKPGTVLVRIESPNVVMPAWKKFSKNVVGAVSNEYAHLIGGEHGEDDLLDHNAPIAMAGTIHVRVKGRVKIGDLLVSSDTEGVAMASRGFLGRRKFVPGTVIGKALENHKKSGEGMIKMLVMLM